MTLGDIYKYIDYPIMDFKKAEEYGKENFPSFYS